MHHLVESFWPGANRLALTCAMVSLVAVLGVYLILKFIIYRVFGIWICSLNLFLWKLQGIHFVNKTVKVYLRSFRITINLFDSRSKLINFVLDGLSIEVTDELSSSRKSDTSNYTEKELLSEYLRPISIYPKSDALRFIIKHSTSWIPSVDIKLKNVQVSLLNTPVKLTILEIESVTDYSINKESQLMSFKSAINISDVIYCFQDDPHKISSTLYLEVSGTLEIQNGIISNLSSQVRSVNLYIPAFTMIKSGVFMSKRSLEKRQLRVKTFNTAPVKPKSNDTLFAEDVCFLSFVVNLVKSISFRFDNITIGKIPMLSSYELSQICDEDFLQKHQHKLIFFKAQLGSLSSNHTVLRENNAGYDINFKKGDHPFQLVTTIMQSLISLDLSRTPSTKEEIKPSEFFELIQIPSITVSTVTNTLYQLIRRIETGSQFADALLNFNCSISNPIVDISSVHLGMIITRLIMIGYHNAVGKHLRQLSNRKCEHKFSRLEYIYYVSSIWPVFNIKFLVERPTIILKTKSLSNKTITMVVLTTSLINVGLFSTKNVNFENDLVYYLRGSANLSDFVLSFIKRSSDSDSVHKDSIEFELAGDEKIVKCSDLSLKFDSKILPELKFSLAFDYGSFSADLSNLVVLNGLADILTDIDEHITPLSLEKFTKLQEIKQSKPRRSISDILKNDIFRDLPSWFSSLKFAGEQFKVTLGTRSVLIPAELVSQLKLPDIIDNVDGSLRKISFYLLDWSIIIENNKQTPMSDFSSSGDFAKTSTYYDSDSSSIEDEVEVDEFWRVQSSWKNAYWKVFTEARLGDGEIDPYSLRSSSIAKVPNLQVVIRSTIDVATKKTTLRLEGDCDQVSAHYSLINHFLVISSFHLINNTFFKPVREKCFRMKGLKKAAKENVAKAYPAIVEKNSAHESLREFLKVFSLKFHTHQFGVQVSLAGDFKFKVGGLRTVFLLNPGDSFSISSSIFRMLVESPTSPGYWTRFLTVNNAKILFDICKVINCGEKRLDELGTVVEITNNGVRFNIPTQFVVHQLFDQISVAYKTLKQLHHSFKYNNTEIVIYPHEMKTPRIPKIKLKSKRFQFKMDDDPFESELSVIFQLGKIEQRRRLAKEAQFKGRLSERLTQDGVDHHMSTNNLNIDGLLESESERKHTNSHLSHLKQRNMTDPGSFRTTSTKSIGRNTQFGEAVQRVDDLSKKLFIFRKHLSRSWIELVRSYRQKLEERIDQNSKFLWNYLKPSSYPPGFNHKLIGHTKAPPLMFLIMENVDLTIKSPNFPLEKVSDYIHDVGKGVPLDTKYTLLIPTHVDLRVGELRIHIRDYPLPLCHIPPVSPNQDQSISALRIHGTFVVGEKLLTRPENIRTIYVPLVPMAKKSVNDKYFALNVPKTIESIKMYTNLEFDISSDSETRFTWGQSYQPAIQQIILNFDDFTKPQLDPSEKIGFWDKVRSILHARIRFRWHHGGSLVVAMKGSRNPYEVAGLSGGFLLSFANNVILDINGDDNPKLLLQVTAGDVGWSVPNHLALPLLLWYRESSGALFVPELNDSNFAFLYAYYFEDQEGYDPQKAKTMSKHYQEKKALRFCGNVSFKIGLSFERDDQDGNRTSEFRPHYDVKLSNPKYVDDVEHYDAYDGFRSKYAHMSLSLVSPNTMTDTMKGKNSTGLKSSTSPESYNVGRLSPKAMTHFFAWWKLFSGNMELPVRRGKLFGPNKASKKFSEVLSSFQYQFLISPLHLSHTVRLDSRLENRDFQSECVGLKTKVDSFTIDLHQRKEVIVNKYSELDKTKSIQKMKMYLGEVEVSDVDLRAVKAIFKGRSSEYDDDDVLEFGKSSKYEEKNVFKTYDNDSSWLDLEDYEEIDHPTIKNSESYIHILPLLFTPRFTYLRQLDHTTPQGTTPADNKLAHDCVLGTNKFVETQRLLLKARVEELEHQITSSTDKKIINNLKKAVENVQKLLEVLDSSDSDKTGDLVDSDDANGFNNKFVIHNVQIKWNKTVRNIIFKYSHFISERRAILRYLRYQSFAIIDRIVEDQKNEADTEETKLERFQTMKSEYLEEHHTRRDEFTYDKLSCSERLENFEEDLRSVINSSFRSSDDYLVKLVSPQIQLSPDDVDSDSCVMVTSPEIDLKIVSIKQSSSFDENGNPILVDNEDFVLEKRYGSLFKDANIFVVYKKQVINDHSSHYMENAYGSTSNWPPWIGVELCHNGESLNDNMILKKTSLVFRYDQVRDILLQNNMRGRKRVIVDVPEVITSCDSDQYYAFYDMILSLLLYQEPSDTEFHEKLTSLILTTDFTDLNDVRDRIRKLQITHTTLTNVGMCFSYRRAILSDEELEILKLLIQTRSEVVSELFLLMRLISKGTTSSTMNNDEELEWTIRADNVKVHMLDQSRNPFIDLSIKNAVFRRIEESSNSNTNIVQVNEFKAYNLEKGAAFPEMVMAYRSHNDEKEQNGNGHASSEDADKSIVIEWAMDHPVGGIKVVRSVTVNLLPIKISMEQQTGEKLFNYLFPPSENEKGFSLPGSHPRQEPIKEKDDAERLIDMKKQKNHSVFKPSKLRSFNRSSDLNGNGVKNHQDSSDDSSIHSTESKNKSLLSLRPLRSNNSGSSTNSSIPSVSVHATSDPRYVTQMINRASMFMSIVSLAINSFVLNISFRGEGKYRLINVSNLTLKLPKLEFKNRIWTMEDLINHVKKLIIKLVVGHSGVILLNKLTHHRKNKAQLITIDDDEYDLESKA